MSEPITKACPRCDGTWCHAHGDDWACPDCAAACPDCHGTGRVPDVEATLRAEVARLTKERDAWRNSYESNVANSTIITDEIMRLTAQLAERDAALATAQAEIKRLEGREREAAALFRSSDPWRPEKCGAYYDATAAWLAGCKS